MVPLLSSFSSAQFSSTQLDRSNVPLFSLCHEPLLLLAPIATLTKTRGEVLVSLMSKPLNHKTFLVVVPLLSSFSSAQFSSTQLGRGNAPLFSLCHELSLHLHESTKWSSKDSFDDPCLPTTVQRIEFHKVESTMNKKPRQSPLHMVVSINDAVTGYHSIILHGRLLATFLYNATLCFHPYIMCKGWKYHLFYHLWRKLAVNLLMWVSNKVIICT